MKKQKVLRSAQRLLLAAFAAITIIIGTTFSASAQDQQTYKVGDRVMASPLFMKDEKSYRPCTIIKKTTSNSFLLKCDPHNGLPSAEYSVREDYMRPQNERDENEQSNKADKDQNTDADKKAEAKQNSSGYKVGDRVKASPAFLKDEKYYQPCTITQKTTSNSYRLRCDPHNSLSFMDYTVREDYIRPWTGATPAPTFECSFEQPPGTVTRTSPATAATFKRVIYDSPWNAGATKTKLGMQFEIFQMGKAYKNLLTGRGLMHDGAPQNVMIYPVKTKYRSCKEGSDYNYLEVVEQNFACFKDKFGDWVCPVASGRKYLEKQSVPKEQK